jgi:hypothetical protein
MLWNGNRMFQRAKKWATETAEWPGYCIVPGKGMVTLQQKLQMNSLSQWPVGGIGSI